MVLHWTEERSLTMLIYPLRIEMLGGLRILRGTQSITNLRSHKIARLLAYLAFYPTRPHPRDELLDLLWPEEDPELTRNRLRVGLNTLRHHLEGSGISSGTVLLADRLTIQLHPGSFSSDVALFETTFTEALQAEVETRRVSLLLAAVEAYGGTLLPDDSADWVLGERERLAQSYLQAVRRLVRCLANVHDYERALVYARQAVQADDLREESHRDVMRLCVALGQPSAALHQYQELTRRLRQTMDVAPSAVTRALAGQIAEHLGLSNPGEYVAAGISSGRAASVRKAKKPEADPPSEAGSVAALGPRGLPVFLTRFFGRENELRDLTKWLRPLLSDSPLLSERTQSNLPLITSEEAARNEGEAGLSESSSLSSYPGDAGPGTALRLVTLTGPGGTGKTRLAAEAAQRLRPIYHENICFVSLADLTDSRRISEAILDALGLLRTANAEPLQQVLEALSQQPSLLVLDNFEHLSEGGTPIITTLLEQAPAVTCLVTSRRSLGLPGEREIFVSPLPVPSPAEAGADRSYAPVSLSLPAALLECASVQLFVDRARAVLPHFQITPNNAADVAALCRRLEGIPLAIELAATRARALTAAQMLAHLESRFALLVNRRADKDMRHRSLWATLQGSYQMLTPERRRLFARLSVFQGGWCLAAAREVCRESEALEGLEDLQTDSLIQGEEVQGEQRFRMLVTLREFADEHLEAGERAELSSRHALFYLALAEEAAPHLKGVQQSFWLDRLQGERENLGAALSWCENDPDGAEVGLRLAYALERFWYVRGYLSEGRARCMAALAHPGAQAYVALRAGVLNRAGSLAQHQEDLHAAGQLFEQSLTMYRELKDPQHVSHLLGNLGNVAMLQGDYISARALHEKALAIQRTNDYRDDLGRTLNSLGIIAKRQENYAEAQRMYEQSLAISRATGDDFQIAVLLGNLGNLAEIQGDYLSARSLLEDGLAIHRRLGNRGAIVPALGNLATTVICLGDHERGRSYLRECLMLCKEMGMTRTIVTVLSNFAGLLYKEGAWKRAAWLYGVTEGEGERQGVALPSMEREERDRIYSELRAALGEGAFATAFLRGRAMALEQVVSELLSDEKLK
jgi:predicted ATPase/DNA-binding SARP family transcriptional activator